MDICHYNALDTFFLINHCITFFFSFFSRKVFSLITRIGNGIDLIDNDDLIPFFGSNEIEKKKYIYLVTGKPYHSTFRIGIANCIVYEISIDEIPFVCINDH